MKVMRILTLVLSSLTKHNQFSSQFLTDHDVLAPNHLGPPPSDAL